MKCQTNKEIIKDLVDTLKSGGVSNTEIANLFDIRPVDVVDIIDGTFSDEVEAMVVKSFSFRDKVAFNVLVNVISGAYDKFGRNCHSCHFPGPSPLAMAIMSLN